MSALTRPGLNHKPHICFCTYAAREASQVETGVDNYNIAATPYLSAHIANVQSNVNGSINNGLFKLVTSILRKVYTNTDCMCRHCCSTCSSAPKRQPYMASCVHIARSLSYSTSRARKRKQKSGHRYTMIMLSNASSTTML